MDQTPSKTVQPIEKTNAPSSISAKRFTATIPYRRWVALGDSGYLKYPSVARHFAAAPSFRR